MSGSAAFYATNVTQLLLGFVICVTNALVLSAIILRQQLKTSTNLLLGNICFSNLIVGMMLCVINVMDGWTEVALLKTETSLVIINTYITVASFLGLITSKHVAIRNAGYQMSLGSCAKVLATMWIVVLALLLIKSLVFAFSQMNYTGACFRCYQVFEVVTLVIFTLSTIIAYILCAYRIMAFRHRTIHDESRPVGINYASEYRMVLSIGLMLLVFLAGFVLFVVMYITWLGAGSLLDSADEILITLFFLHSIINPLIYCCRDAELGETVKRLMCCRGGPPDNPLLFAPVRPALSHIVARSEVPDDQIIPPPPLPRANPSAPPDLIPLNGELEFREVSRIEQIPLQRSHAGTPLPPINSLPLIANQQRPDYNIVLESANQRSTPMSHESTESRKSSHVNGFAVRQDDQLSCV